MRHILIILALSACCLAQVLTVPNGGTGNGTLTAHGPLIGNGTGPVTVGGRGIAGQCWLSGGLSADPSFQTCPGGGAGSVTSVGLSLPSGIWNVSGSPVTGTGILTGTYASQSAGQVFASPALVAGVPSFRSLVPGDLPANFKFQYNDAPVATQMTIDFIDGVLPGGGVTNVFTGTATMGTSAIASGACASPVTVSATGVATTDAIIATPNTDPTAVTGYGPSASGSLYIMAYPTANNVNFKVCNNTSASITPSALTMNVKVVR